MTALQEKAGGHQDATPAPVQSQPETEAVEVEAGQRCPHRFRVEPNVVPLGNGWQMTFRVVCPLCGIQFEMLDQRGGVGSFTSLTIGEPGVLVGKNKTAKPATQVTENPEKKTPDPSLARSKLNRSGLKAGAVAPEFTLPRIDGGELSLSDLRGTRVLLVFSDPKCGPCDRLAPQLQQVYDRSHAVQILMVSRRDVEANREKAAKFGLTFPIVLQKMWEISKDYGMFSTPIGYLIDENGILLSDVAVGGDAILGLVK